MLDYLGLDAQLKAEEKGSKIIITIASEEAGRIIGRKGQTLESLQMLLNRMIFNSDQECPRIALDIDGYGKEREGERRGGGRGDKRGRGGRGDKRGHGDESFNDENEDGDNSDILRRQALDAAKEAKRWGESVTLPKMNAHDRRIIHITLQEDPEITTESLGEGSLKKVVISVKK
jgi:spoIIIJ-associated protein